MAQWRPTIGLGFKFKDYVFQYFWASKSKWFESISRTTIKVRLDFFGYLPEDVTPQKSRHIVHHFAPQNVTESALSFKEFFQILRNCPIVWVIWQENFPTHVVSIYHYGWEVGPPLCTWDMRTIKPGAWHLRVLYADEKNILPPGFTSSASQV